MRWPSQSPQKQQPARGWGGERSLGPPPRNRRLSHGTMGLGSSSHCPSEETTAQLGLHPASAISRPASGLQSTLPSVTLTLASQFASQDRPPGILTSHHRPQLCPSPWEPGPDCVTMKASRESLGPPPRTPPGGCSRLPLRPHCTSGAPRMHTM